VIENASEDLKCDVLIFITTSSEQDALKTAAKEAGVGFRRRNMNEVGEYFQLGIIGATRVNAVRTKMGPFSHGGSAAKAIIFKIASGATAIIQLGMAFGIDPNLQNAGDVLVSTSIIPYDDRDVVAEGIVCEVMPAAQQGIDDAIEGADSIDQSAATRGSIQPSARPHPELFGSRTGVVGRVLGAFTPRRFATLWRDMLRSPSPAKQHTYQTIYPRVLRHHAKPSLLELLKREENRGGYGHRIQFGGMLSGGARIFSSQYLKELVNSVPNAEDGIIGGDMEGVGLLSISPPEDPLWVVVKGISDFADENRGSIDLDEVRKALFKDQRRTACQNSARFVLRALANAEKI